VKGMGVGGSERGWERLGFAVVRHGRGSLKRGLNVCLVDLRFVGVPRCGVVAGDGGECDGTCGEVACSA